MKRFIICIAFSLFSLSAFSQECAENIGELKALVGNKSMPMRWKENTTKNPLFLSILNNPNGSISLNLKTVKGTWAVATGIVCGRGINFVAKIQKTSNGARKHLDW